MRVLACLTLTSWLLLAAPLAAQTAPAADPATQAALDAQITKLEGELSKLRDTSPEAAELMVQLIDLYHNDGRVFGLIRVGQTFVATHLTHPRHRDAMLSLIDGMIITSRNKEVTTLARQFLQRYPADKACADVELALARALEQTDDRMRAAEAYEVVWNRLGNTLEGRRAAFRAIAFFAAFNNKDGSIRAAQVAESLSDKTNGEMASRAGLDALLQYQRWSEWAKSNAVGLKLIKRNLPTEPPLRAYVHSLVATNEANLGQRVNAIDHLRKAKALTDTPELLLRILGEMNAAQATPDQMLPLVNELFQKYPERTDRYTYKNYLASAYIRAKDNANAIEIYKEIMLNESNQTDAPSNFVVYHAVDAEKYAETEAVLRDALAKNPKIATSIRYALAFHLYRDRVKDLAKARVVAREIINAPVNSSWVGDAVMWLLSNPETEATFQADLQLVLKVREQHANLPPLRNYLNSWFNQVKANKDLKDRATWAKTQIDAADKSPNLELWIASEGSNARAAFEAREKILAPPNYAKLNDDQVRMVMPAQAYSLRYSNVPEQRLKSIEMYGTLTKRFPTDFTLAQSYMEVSSDYAPPEVAKEAGLNYLKLDPPRNNADGWRRLMIVGDKLTDPAFLKHVWEQAQKSMAKYGPDMTYAATIGDTLEKHGFKDEALAHWKRCTEVTPDSYEARVCAERLATRLEGPARVAYLRQLFAKKTEYHGFYAYWIALESYKAGDIDAADKILRESLALQSERYTSRAWGIDDYSLIVSFVDPTRADKMMDEAKKRKVWTFVRDMDLFRSRAVAQLALLEITPPGSMKPIERLRAYQHVTTQVGNDSGDWDTLMPYVQAAMTNKDYAAAATLTTGMLANIPNADVTRKKTGRDLVGQSYSRMGGSGLAIDESSPIAPLLQAAMYLRLGDERLAFDTYAANRPLFDENRDQLPVELILFVCENHIAAGGDENHDRAEDILRNWLVKQSEAKDIEDGVKASVQLMLAKNFFKSQRFDVARSEYQTVVNRWPKASQAIEAEFGIGESYMAQKVYDQAEAVFEKLINSKDRDTVIRAEFLRGVLANRRGDRDQARDIFKGVLDRVPSLELANQALFNLAEVYGAEQRYMDQLELLRTVGRLGRTSQRWHSPGMALAIVVQDSDLGISRGHARIPVRVSTEPGGDSEVIYLYSGGAGKGLFRADLETRLGAAVKGDKILQLTGQDTIRCDYPDEFKAEFKTVPLSDAEIKVASDAKFQVASAKIIDEKEETFSERLEREAREREAARTAIADERPKDQIKPGNLIYIRVQDPDRDLGAELDSLTVKLVATSGDQVQVKLVETGPHTGIFEATATTGDLPAGATATDTSIEHSPLMAIDKDPQTFWLSEPDGATPKLLSIDMKDLKQVDHVVMTSPQTDQQIPVRGEIEGSNDGRFWFKLATTPAQTPAEAVAGEYGRMTRRIYDGNYTNYTWEQIVNLTKNSQPVETMTVNELSYIVPDDANPMGNVRQSPRGVVYHGKFVQARAGAARFRLEGSRTALALDGRLELPPGESNRTVDVWLEAGLHDLTVFFASANNQPTTNVTISREDHSSTQLTFSPFTAADFDLSRPEAKPAVLRKPGELVAGEGKWEATFDPIGLRHVRFVIREYLGEAVAVNHVTIADRAAAVAHIPTEADVLSLSTNEVLEIAAGDKVVASYADELTLAGTGRSQLLTSTLTATYHNASVSTIAYEFVRQPSGQVTNIRKDLVRIDPGQRIIVEITDYDLDVTAGLDQLKFQVSVNDGEPIELTATEIEERPGVFTKEVDTSETPEEGKLTVKPGDRVICRYLDEQNTFPGHSVPREAVVYVVEPTPGQVRIVETRYVHPPARSTAPPRIIYLPQVVDKPTSSVAFEVPLTVEVIDPDAARDSRSTVTVKLETTAGAMVEVECVIGRDLSKTTQVSPRKLIEEGRFVGQIILQLGGKDSPDIVPLVASMPRNLLGGGKLPEGDQAGEETVVTRVLNVAGKDIIQATYADSSRPEGAPEQLSAQGRLIANAAMLVVDRDYEKEVNQLHVGEKLYLRITDADLDTTDERDRATVTITTARGESELIELEETLTHSGIFTGSVLLKPQETPTPSNSTPGEPVIETYFGDTVTITYVDKAASTESGELELKIEVPVVVGTDGLVAAFSKTFGNEQLAVETQFHIAESYFELFKSHQKLERSSEQRDDLEAGRRVLREVMEDYPNPKYIPRIAYLLGQFSQELKEWHEAIDSYQLIVKQYPDSTLAPDAQYKLAQCYEEQGDFDQALEAYVTLAATYPKSQLIANVMIRISEYFYKAENFEVAAQVGEKFLERFEGHEWAPRMAFRIGQCYYKAKEYPRAGKSFDLFAKVFPDDPLCADSLFWAGESWRMGNNVPEAFRRYNRCRWDFPSSEAAKYARGRLALPEMLRQFEVEANVEE